MIFFVLISQATIGSDAASRPWELFRSTCIEGAAPEVQGDIQPAHPSDMPLEAKHALGRNLIDAGLLASVGVNFTVVASDYFENPLYRFGDGQSFLMLPVQQAKQKTGMLGLCAVAVKGQHYLDALRVVDPKASTRLEQKLTRSSKVVSVPEYRHRESRREISIVEVDGWTSAAVNSDK